MNVEQYYQLVGLFGWELAGILVRIRFGYSQESRDAAANFILFTDTP